MTCEEVLSFKHKEWVSFSKYVKFLLCWMLEKSAEKRATLEETLNHKWFDEVREQ